MNNRINVFFLFQSMAECTQIMDPHTWNAYHIISNRARSVCYATRRQQFEMKTENVVNRLASSAEDQIDKMWKLKVRMAYSVSNISLLVIN